MSKFIIKGGNPLHGTLKPVGNKNAALPMVAASLLTDQPITLKNVPRIEDVSVMLELLSSMGVEIDQRGRTLTLCASRLKSRILTGDLYKRIRGSVLLAGPLLARHGRVQLTTPGGDVIGRRRIDTHVDGLCALGAKSTGDKNVTLSARQLKGAKLLLDEASVTATENILMAACLSSGTTEIFNAACEPHVQDLGALLIKMGAEITGLGTNRIVVRGVKSLRGATHTIAPDHVEIGSYIAAAAATRGDLTITGIKDRLALTVIQKAYGRLGVSSELKGSTLRCSQSKSLAIRRDLGSAIPKIEDGIWPAFPSDLMSVALVVATQAKGSILFFEKLFESRMYFVDRLIEMGAQIIQCDPHRVVVTGPSRLHATHQTSPDIRAGMALIIAALCAKGESCIDHAQVIDRGYESIDERLRELGASIDRID